MGLVLIISPRQQQLCQSLKECTEVEEHQPCFVNCVMSDCCRIVIGDHSNEDEIAQVCHGQGMIITTLLSDFEGNECKYCLHIF